jgi:GT2 family glycosyltransferase
MTAVLDTAPAAEAAAQLPTGSVFWACIHGEDVRGAFMSSVVGALTSPAAVLVGAFYDLASGPVLSIARNTCAEEFLTSGQEWLWFVDTDTVFAPDVLPRLLALADPVQRPIVAAAVPIGGRDPRERMQQVTGIPELFWAAYRSDEVGGLRPLRVTDPVGECERVDAVGTGCVLIHRTVLEAIGPGPFCELSAGNAVMGEDLAFCRRADALGIPVHVAGQVRVGHAKVVTL